MLFFRTLTLHPRETGVRIRMYGALAQAVATAWEQHSARKPERAPA